MHVEVKSVAQMQEEFLEVLPKIEKAIGWVLLNCPRSERPEAAQEAVALAWKHYRRLAERGKQPETFPTIVGRWAAKHVLTGRRLAGRTTSKDVMSRTAQNQRGFAVRPLDSRLQAALAADQRAKVVNQVAFRIDFPEWLASMSDRDRHIAADLAAGHSAGEVAKRFGVCKARISQKRKEFARSWQRFHQGATA